MGEFYFDIPRVYSAIAEWGSCMVYLLVLRENKIDKKFIASSIGALFIQVIYMILTKDVPVLFWLPCMFGACCIMYGLLLYGSKLGKLAVVYCCVKSFLVAEFVASLEWQIDMYLLWAYGPSLMRQMIVFAVIYGVCFFFVYKLEYSQNESDYLSQITVREVLSATGIVLAFFCFSNLSFIDGSSPFTSSLKEDIFNIRTIIDLSGLGILFAYQSRVCEYMAEKEITSIESVLKSQYDQYRNYQDSLELIHMKYHDLKHQIAGLRAESDEKKRKEWLDAMEEQAKALEITSSTGNSVLDTILAAKIFMCRKNNIQITCVADGQAIEFMHVTDICSIFGNALDNAIEHVVLIPELEKRLVHVSVISKKGFVLIKVENYCNQEIDFTEENLIQTSKKDKNNHGYGLKSIKYVTEKYGGTVQMGTKNAWFELVILIPKQGANES